MSHDHYKKSVKHLDMIDVYRVLDLWQVTSPPLQHALKKIIAAGQRGAKNEAKDVQEAIDSLKRWQDMKAEDEKKIEPVGVVESYKAMIQQNRKSFGSIYFETQK